MTRFDYVDDAARPHVVFGVGSVSDVAAEVDRLDCHRVVLISTKSAAKPAAAIAAALGEALVGRIDVVAMHVPIQEVASARELVAQSSADLLLCLGGGSAVGLAKAVAHATAGHTTAVSILAVPTTYSGSEMTTIWGQTADGNKQTGRDPQVLPRTVIYDPALTTGLPTNVSMTSGLNAIAHCMESLYAPNATSTSTDLAADGLDCLVTALPVLYADPGDIHARALALHGARRAGQALESTQMGLHHVLCHALGGIADLPHSSTHAALLPYVIAWNEAAAGSSLDPARNALGTAKNHVSGVGPRLWDFSRRLGAPASLAELGLQAHQVASVVQAVDLTTVSHPRRPSAIDVQQILLSALAGERPSRSTDG